MSGGGCWYWRTKPSPTARSGTRSRTELVPARPRCFWSHRRSTPAACTGARMKISGVPKPRAGSTKPLPSLTSAGVDAHGVVGDADPLKAIEQALRTFARGRGPYRDESPTASRARSRVGRRCEGARALSRFPLLTPSPTRSVSEPGEQEPGFSSEPPGGLDDVVGDRLDLLLGELVSEGRHRARTVRHVLDHGLTWQAWTRRGSAPPCPSSPASCSV